MRAKLIRDKEGKAIKFYMDLTDLSDQNREDFKKELTSALGKYGNKSEWKIYLLLILALGATSLLGYLTDIDKLETLIR